MAVKVPNKLIINVFSMFIFSNKIIMLLLRDENQGWVLARYMN